MQIKPIFNTDSTIDQSNYYCFKDGFSEQELEWIDNLKELYPYEEASVVGGDEVKNVRKSKVKWIHVDDKSHWVYDKIQSFILEANNVWKLDLHSIVDSIQYTEYYDDGGHYGWHMDIGPHPINHRKVSITIQLSNPEDYDGGELELWTGAGIQKVEKHKGCAILFPSYMLHRITPVTKGVRKSLVLWVGGSTFR
jgi:PKHD-type hydroxylase